PQVEVADITAATTYVTVYQGTTNGSKVVSMVATSTDTAAQTLTCRLSKNSAASTPILFTISLAINSGNVAGSPPPPPPTPPPPFAHLGPLRHQRRQPFHFLDPRKQQNRVPGRGHHRHEAHLHHRDRW